MKKVMLLATLVLVYTTTFAQKKEKKEKEIPPYQLKASLLTNWANKDSANPGKNFEFNVRGVYNHFGYDVAWIRPFDNKQNWGLNDMKILTLAYGINRKISYGQRVLDEKSYHLAAGIGPTLMLTPKPDSIKKKNNNDLFLGGTIFATIRSEESGFEADAKIMVTTLPANNDSMPSETVLIPEIQIKKFFGGVFGISAGYRVLAYSMSERQVVGKPYRATKITQTRSDISLGLCARFRTLTFLGGVIIPREKFKMSDNTLSGSTNYFNASTGRTTISIGLQINLDNPPK